MKICLSIVNILLAVVVVALNWLILGEQQVFEVGGITVNTAQLAYLNRLIGFMFIAQIIIFNKAAIKQLWERFK